MTDKRTRRGFLTTAAALAVAGCSQSSPSGTTQTTGSATGSGPTTTGTATAGSSGYPLAEVPTLDSPDETSDGIETFRQVTYATPGGAPVTLDLHRPTSGGPHPLLVHVHGGGWFFESNKFDEERRQQASEGMAVASIRYRLSKTTLYPGAVRDVVAAITWLRDRAADPAGIDPERFALIGESAGAHLSALVGTAPTHETFQPAGVETRAEGAAGVVGISGIYNLQPEQAGSDQSANRFFGCSGSECPEKYEEASPIVHVDGEDPPTLLYHGTADERIPYRTAPQYERALEDAGVPVTLVTGDGGEHVTPYQDPWGDRMRTQQEQFLTEHLDL